MSINKEHLPDRQSENQADPFGRPFTVGFDQQSGLSSDRVSTKRYLSKLRTVFSDTEALSALLMHDDPLVYEFYEMQMPDHPGDLQFGTSIVYPGKVGREYYMTKGHFHEILETAEVYYVLQGSGFMVMETPEGQTQAEPLRAGRALYVPPRWAHRTVNTGNTPLITFFVFRGDAGHDYGTIEKKGFRTLILVGEDSLPEIVPNPSWRG